MKLVSEDILDGLTSWGILRAGETARWRHRLRSDRRLRRGERLMRELVRAGRLTRFQAGRIYQGNGATLLVGDYLLQDRLGAGAMGRVYRALHRPTKQTVALKILRSELTESARHLERFHREAQAARRLKHPHLVVALDAGSADDVYYLAMEYVDGPNLDAWLREHGPLAVDQAVRFARQAARGLAYAHDRGVVHRDVKPSNLLIGPKDRIKILDMGVARVLSDGEAVEGDRLTRSGQLLGTPHYIAPEQALDPRNADAQADIYALGCTLYRMLTGEPPYGGESDFDILMAHLRAPVPSLRDKRPDVPESLDLVYRRMMAKKPEHRYLSMRTVVADLERIGKPASNVAPARPTFDRASALAETATALDSPLAAKGPRVRWRWEDEPAADAPSPPLAAVAGNAERGAANAELGAQSAERTDERTPPLAVVAPVAAPAGAAEVPATAPAPMRRRDLRRNGVRSWAPTMYACVASAALLLGGLWFAARMERSGWASLDVYPSEAVVEVFGEGDSLQMRRLAEGEVIFRAAPGIYRVQVTKDGFAPYVRDFVLQSGRRTTMRAVLQRDS